MEKILWNRRGISPVLSSLLLTVIAVAGMSIAITATYVITGNLRETMGERFIVEDVWFKTETDEIAIYIRNTGKIPIKIVAVYVNYTSESFTPRPLELGLEDHGWLNVTYGLDSGYVYHINIVTSRGTQVADYYKSQS